MWFKLLQQGDKTFRRAYDKKLGCVGLVSVLQVAPENLPPAVSQSLPMVRMSLRPLCVVL